MCSKLLTKYTYTWSQNQPEAQPQTSRVSMSLDNYVPFQKMNPQMQCSPKYIFFKCLNLRAFSEQIPVIFKYVEHRNFDVVSNSSQISPTPMTSRQNSGMVDHYHPPSLPSHYSSLFILTVKNALLHLLRNFFTSQILIVIQ